ncbi:MAG: hypothetical protein ING25_10875 [Burkholderiales bacterium]|nr:hypothetical protein [Burkholderiales bacterium]
MSNTLFNLMWAAIVAAFLVLLGGALYGDILNTRTYKAECALRGGTTVFNGKHYECLMNTKPTGQ